MNLPSSLWSRVFSGSHCIRPEDRRPAGDGAFARLAVVAALGAAASCFGPLVSSANAADLSKLSPDLAATVASEIFAPSYAANSRKISASGASAVSAPRFRVIVRAESKSLSARAVQQRVRGKVSRLGRTFDAVGIMVIEATAKELLALSDDPAVTGLSPDRAVGSSQDDYIGIATTPLETNRRAVGADIANQAVPGMLNPTGEGVKVAVIDSGVYPTGDLTDKVLAFKDFVNGRLLPYDDFGHGTHVAGIIAGSGAASNGANATQSFRGIAPAVQVIGLKVLDENGSGSVSNVIAALNWCVLNKALYNIRIINMSLGSGVYESYRTDPLCQAAARASAMGITVIASTGNWGGIYGGVTSPANHPDVIGVGASNSCATLYRNDDVITSYSGRGPSRFDQVVKPDVIAPGNNIVSLRVPNGTLDREFPEARVAPSEYLRFSDGIESSYTRLSGTSMAAPMVAGAAALVAHYNTVALTPSGIKAALMYSAQLLTGYDPLLKQTVTYDPFTQGAGLLNIPGAVEMAFRIKPDGLYGKPALCSFIGGYAVPWAGATLPGLLIRPAGVSPINLLYCAPTAWGSGSLLWNTSAFGTQWSDELVWGSNISWGGHNEKPGNGFSVPAEPDMIWGSSTVWGSSSSRVNPDNLIFGGLGNTGSTKGNSTVTGQNISWGGHNEDTRKIVEPDPDTGY